MEVDKLESSSSTGARLRASLSASNRRAASTTWSSAAVFTLCAGIFSFLRVNVLLYHYIVYIVIVKQNLYVKQ
jgi:hypothetical protein